MTELLNGLPLPAWLAAGIALGAWLARPIGEMLRLLTGRKSDLEEVIDLLRKALDKGRIRESAAWALVDLFIFAIDHWADPPPAIAELRDRARSVLEDAQRHIQTINEEPRG